MPGQPPAAIPNPRLSRVSRYLSALGHRNGMGVEVFRTCSRIGMDTIAENTALPIRRVTTISIQCELLEGRIAKGEMIDDTDGICAGTSSIRQWR
jgi:hypothetical protein